MASQSEEKLHISHEVSTYLVERFDLIYKARGYGSRSSAIVAAMLRFADEEEARLGWNPGFSKPAPVVASAPQPVATEPVRSLEVVGGQPGRWSGYKSSIGHIISQLPPAR